MSHQAQVQVLLTTRIPSVIKYRLSCGLAILGMALAVPFLAQGAEGEPQLADLLSAAGYALDEVSVLLVWEERSPVTDAMVQGVRLQNATGGDALDLYFADGALLDKVGQSALGIRAKRWDLAPVSRPAEQVPYAATVAATLPAPKAASVPKPRIALPVPNVAALQAEDAAALAAGDKSALRYGARVAPYKPIQVNGFNASAGAWRLEGAYWIWTLELGAAGALGQRVHFRELQLPETGELLLYDARDPSEVYAIEPEGAAFWGPTCFSETITLECTVSTQADIDQVQLLIDETTYNYRAMGELPWKQAGSCNIDFACESEWAATGLGVGGLGSVGSSGSLWCTGALIVDTDPATNIPYFATANHCVDGQSEASSIEVYWFYQTPSCNGTEPDPATVPRTTGGSDYLAGSGGVTGTDFTLLRLRNQPPGGVTYLGFNTSPQALTADVVCIHHPRGDFKRISFGDITNIGNPRLQPISRYHEVLWNRGTTEPGSSGSPLFVEDTQQFIGQLWGGLASCSARSEPDYYGRFDVSYPLVSSWLAVGPPSIYDVNGDGQVNSIDLQLVVNAALGKSDLEDADFDDSGRVDASDVQSVVTAILTPGT
jgi:hypothetical protein